MCQTARTPLRAVPVRLHGGGVRPELLVEREAIGDRRHALGQLALGLLEPRLQRTGDQAADLAEVVLGEAARGQGGRADAEAGGDHRRPRVERDRVAVDRYADLVQAVGAAVALKKDAEASPEELRDYVKARVAAYKYPRLVWLVDTLPKGPTGKVQKRDITVPTTESTR